MQTDQQNIFNSLKGKGPEAWREYLRSFEKGQPLAGLNMQVIFHYVAPKATEQDSLDWADVAVRAAELEALNSSGTARENALLRAMQHRSWFIAKRGSRPNHPVLDKEVILSWAVQGLDISIQTAKEKSTQIGKGVERVKGSSNLGDRQQVHDDLKQLRRIKHRLAVLKVLADCGELPKDSILNEWLQIREQLP